MLHSTSSAAKIMSPAHKQVCTSFTGPPQTRKLLPRSSLALKQSCTSFTEPPPRLKRCHRMGCSPLKLSPRTRDPRITCPSGQLVLGPRVPLGQLVPGPCFPLRTSWPPMSQRLPSTWTILGSRSVHQNYCKLDIQTLFALVL